MKVSDCIQRYDGLIPLVWCNVIKDFIEKQNLEPMLTGKANIPREDIRKVNGFGFHKDNLNFGHLDYPSRKKLIPKVLFFKNISTLLQVPFLNYSTTLKHVEKSLEVKQVDFLKYGTNGKYEIHCDEFSNCRERSVTAIINLNESYKGGEFEFYSPFNDELIRQENLKTGSVIMFPSNFVFPHSVRPITEGERYSLVCWLG